MLDKRFGGLRYEDLVQKLRTYNFSSPNNDSDTAEFRHPFFKKNRYQDLLLIKKRKQGKTIKKQDLSLCRANYSIPSSDSLAEQIQRLANIIDSLIQNNNLLVTTNNIMMSQLKILKDQCDYKMTDVLGMLLTTISVPKNPFLDLFRQIFCDFNIKSNLNYKMNKIEGSQINFQGFLDDASTDKLSLFTLFERMNTSYVVLKNKMLAKVAHMNMGSEIPCDTNFGQIGQIGEVQNYCSVQEQSRDNTLSLSNQTDSFCFTTHSMLNEKNRLYSKDDIVLEEMKCVTRLMDENQHHDSKNPTSMSVSSYISPNRFSGEDF